MKKYKIASILMLIHGGLVEIVGCLALIPFLFSESIRANLGQSFSFIVPYLQENMGLMIVIGCMYGIIRIVGAAGLLKNRMWGLVLSVINCSVTLALMVFMLPAGIMDGILASAALILILTQYYGMKEIPENRETLKKH